MTDERVATDGFGKPYRMGRDSKQTGKERGGVCLYVSEKFCNKANVTVKQRMCTPELDLISESLRPRYLHASSGGSSSLSSMPLFTIRPLLHVLGKRSPPPSVTFS